jgi:parallel beta-helix repeat protein
MTFRNSVFRHNWGPGLWFDVSCYDVTVAGNQFVDNFGHGMSFEISSTGIFVNNVVENNGETGFKINDSNNVQVWNNVFGGNVRNLWIVQDSRRGSDTAQPGHDPRRPNPDPTEPWIIFDVTVMNNIIEPAANGAEQVYVNDASGQYSAAQLRADINGNLFMRQSGTEIAWGTGGNRLALYSSTAAFHAATGHGAANTEASGGTPSAAQVAAAQPLPIPADVANAAGVAPNTRHVGPF